VTGHLLEPAWINKLPCRGEVKRRRMADFVWQARDNFIKRITVNSPGKKTRKPT